MAGGEPHGLGLIGPLRAGGVRLLMAVSLGVGVAVAAVELGITAFAADHGARAAAGALIAAQATGSLVGGLVYGARTWRSSPPNRLLLFSVVLAVTTIPLMALPSMALAFPLMLVSGVALAPVVSVMYTLLDSVAPSGTAAEATGWVLTAFVIGASAGTGTAGAVVNASGPHAGIAVGLAGVGVTAIAAWLGRSSLEPGVVPGEQPFARVHSV